VTWTAEIQRWDEDEAEVRVDVNFLNDGQVVASEQVTKPAGTPEARVLEEIGKRGRKARKDFKQDPSANVGRVFKLDDL
jgi:hypothetical protein